MKNFKQTIPAIIFGLLVVGAVSFADIKTQVDTNCTPPSCNPDTPVFTVDDQVKTGGFTADYIGSTTGIDIQDQLIIGKEILTTRNTDGGLRVVNGLTFFKDNLYISDPINNSDISITADPYSTPTTPQYDLTLRSGSTTNLGTGDYCIKTTSQVTATSAGCPAGSFMTFYNPVAPSTDRAMRCTEINPSSVNNNTGGNKGICP